MKKQFFCALSIFSLLLGCDSDSTSSEAESLQGRIDTLVIIDTAITPKIDTVVLSKTDSIFVSKVDTVVLSKTDSVIVSKVDTVMLSKTDSVIVSKIDTVIVTKIDTVVVIDTIVSLARDTGTGILDFHPDDIMIPILENLTHQKRDHSFTLREKQIVILHFTDIHGHEENLKRIKEFYDHYSKYIDIVIHTGDAIYDRWSDSFDFWANADAEQFLNILGNHDVNFVDNDNNKINVTQQEVYDRYFAPYISNWDVVAPPNAPEKGLMYYYKDISKGTNSEKSNVRFIFLDEYYWNDTQLEWLQTVLDDARSNNFAVVLCRHEGFPLTKYENCPFVSMETFNSSHPLPEAQSAVDDFMAKGGEFVIWLGGHHHQDNIGVLQDYPKQIAFNGDIASLNHTGWGDSWRKKGTTSQDCFTIIGIDRFEKVIRFIRIGANTDRYERKKNSMSINYSTAKLIYSD